MPAGSQLRSRPILTSSRAPRSRRRRAARRTRSPTPALRSAASRQTARRTRSSRRATRRRPAPNDQTFFASTSNGGGAVRGGAERDVTVLGIDLDVPAVANCLTIDFRFLSEEYPEYVGGSVSDSFVAELDVTNWTASGSSVSAPNNFAFDAQGNVISVNTASNDGGRGGRHVVRRSDAAPLRVHARHAGSPHALPVDLRPGRQRLRLGGLRRPARAGDDWRGRLPAGRDCRHDGQGRRRLHGAAGRHGHVHGYGHEQRRSTTPSWTRSPTRCPPASSTCPSRRRASRPTSHR